MAETVVTASGLSRIDFFPLLRLLAEAAGLRGDLEQKRTFFLSSLGRILGLQTVAYQPPGRPWQIVVQDVEESVCVEGFSAAIADGNFNEGVHVLNIEDHSILVCLQEISRGGSAGIMFLKSRNAPAFGAAEVGMVKLLLEEVPWLYDDSLREFPPGSESQELSPREQTVLTLLSQGLSRGDIAGELGLSEYTVADYAKSVFRKIGVNSQSQLIGHALRERPFPNMEDAG